MRRMLVLMMILGSIALAAVAQAGFGPEVTAALQSSKEIYVATRRADGTIGKVVPVWFMYDGDAIYFTTLPTTYKAKRITKGSPLYVWVGSADGPHFVGPAEVLRDPELAARMAPVYARKYWIAWLGLFKPNAERVRGGKTVIVKVRPPA
ncbi:MAG: pyridoxamine 5'-phosphate oxidase family protein [Deltaproteobacteria bacterium]|nr:pyridoxamine 5'-phosphate oxidase family protein [Deltaproteobacteria bacterium]